MQINISGNAKDIMAGFKELVQFVRDYKAIAKAAVVGTVFIVGGTITVLTTFAEKSNASVIAQVGATEKRLDDHLSVSKDRHDLSAKRFDRLEQALIVMNQNQFAQAMHQPLQEIKFEKITDSEKQ